MESPVLSPGRTVSCSAQASLHLVDRRTREAGSEERALFCPFKARTGSPVGKPVVTIGNGQGLPANLANWLGRRSNVVTDDFVDRLAGRAGIEEVRHCGSNGTRLGWRGFKLSILK